MTTNFLSRVERIDPNTLPVGDQDVSVGPGSYSIGTTIKHSLPNFAPFTSTSKREAFGNTDASPAPGSYEVYSDNFTKSRFNPSSTSFKSKSERFQENKSNDIPAAGSYHIKSQFELKKQSPNKRLSHKYLELIRSGNNQPVVPSIPTKSQAFGYEEDEIGVLIPQAPVYAGYTGLKSDSVGPGDYEPKVDPINRTVPKISFGKSASRDKAFGNFLRDTSSAPGPGQYNTFSEFDLISNNIHNTKKANNDVDFIYQLNAARKKPLSVFESKTLRDPLKTSDDLPGPGTYVLPPAITVESPLPPDKQTFSSYGPRFKDIKTSTMIPPTYYNPITSDFDKLKLNILKKKRIINRSDWANNISFNATESRFFHLDKNNTPGPIYYPKVNIADNIPKQNVRAGPFLRGGKERFPEKKEKNVILHEKVAENEINKQIKFFLNKKISKINENKTNKIIKNSAFASNVNRFDIVKDSDFVTPPPTQYNTQIQWSKTIGGPKMVPNKTISKKIYDDTPGPGNYNIPSIIDSKKGYYYNPKNVMLTTSNRDTFTENDIPPVGSYNISTSLLKPTHNIYLSDKYR